MDLTLRDNDGNLRCVVEDVAEVMGGLLPCQALDLNLGDYDGIALEVEGDGQTYKLNLKTADQEDVPECTFQATFDTVPGEQGGPLPLM